MNIWRKLAKNREREREREMIVFCLIYCMPIFALFPVGFVVVVVFSRQ